MLWQNLENKTIGIWGQGREGTAVKEAIAKHCAKYEIIEINEDNTLDIAKCDVLVKSPGVSLYRDEIIEAKAKGIEVTSSTNLFFANKQKNVAVVAITGTKGKSTTSALLHHTLNCMGKNAELGGNIGKPLVELADTTAEWVVAEMSSYQCADCKGNADIGVLLNLYPEHLQWHKTHQQYWADKLNMINQAKQKLLNAKDERTSELADKTGALWFNDKANVHIEDGYFYDGKNKLFSCAELPLLGEHNAENACAVLSVIKMLCLPIAQCEQAFASFQALPHRLQKVAELNGVVFIDDSISTTPETAIAALKALDKGQVMTLIAGGYDRGQDYQELGEYLQSLGNRVRLVVLPDTGKRLLKAAQGVKAKAVDNMQQAVAAAIDLTEKGGTIILSPAAPSYNMYKNFEARGEDFYNCIKKLAK